jgi:hypothetical protein
MAINDTNVAGTYVLMDETGPELKELGSELARTAKEAILLFRRRLGIDLVLSDAPAGYSMRVHGTGEIFPCCAKQ